MINRRNGPRYQIVLALRALFNGGNTEGTNSSKNLCLTFVNVLFYVNLCQDWFCGFQLSLSLILSFCVCMCRHVCVARKLVSWYFEPSQPQRVTSLLKTMFNLSPIYSAPKSSNYKLSMNHKISPDTNLHKTKHTQTSDTTFLKN